MKAKIREIFDSGSHLVEIKLHNKIKLKGYINVNDYIGDRILFTSIDGPEEYRYGALIPYADILGVRRAGLSRRTKILAGIGIAVTAAFVLVGIKN